MWEHPKHLADLALGEREAARPSVYKASLARPNILLAEKVDEARNMVASSNA
jgi:hypothetical protein